MTLPRGDHEEVTPTHRLCKISNISDAGYDDVLFAEPLLFYTEYGVSSSVLAPSLKLSNVGPGPGDRLGPPGAVYTRTCCSDVVSWGSENHVNQMTRLTELELDVKEPQWT